MGLAPEKASRIIVVLEDSHWTTTDPWSNIRVLILKKGSQPFTLVLDLGSVDRYRCLSIPARVEKLFTMSADLV